jgi:hypothetical protein
MFSLLEIFRISVSQLLFPQIRRCLETCAASRAKMTTKNPFRQSNLSTCNAELLYRDSDSTGVDVRKIAWADLLLVRVVDF